MLLDQKNFLKMPSLFLCFARSDCADIFSEFLQDWLELSVRRAKKKKDSNLFIKILSLPLPRLMWFFVLTGFFSCPQSPSSFFSSILASQNTIFENAFLRFFSLYFVPKRSTCL